VNLLYEESPARMVHREYCGLPCRYNLQDHLRAGHMILLTDQWSRRPTKATDALGAVLVEPGHALTHQLTRRWPSDWTLRSRHSERLL